MRTMVRLSLLNIIDLMGVHEFGVNIKLPFIRLEFTVSDLMNFESDISNANRRLEMSKKLKGNRFFKKI